jgi:recombinational DNA repair ATPase RecF
MQEKRAEIEAHYREPLERRLSGLVSKMFPRAQVTLDETLDVASIHRTDQIAGDIHDTFGELSAGASEQIGILARIAMAQTVAPDGGMPVLLDDSFVWTDEGRLERLAGVLHTMSENTQIILLTCHWERLRKRGLSPHHTIDLAELKGGTH